MLVAPRVLVEVISVTPAIRPNWRSSGVATEEAIVSGFAPGSAAETEIVGKSTCGRGDTGRIPKAAAPASATAARSSVVATGRSMNTVDRFIRLPPAAGPGSNLPHVSGGIAATGDRTRDRLPAWCTASAFG